MAITFAKASSQYIETPNVIRGAYGFTVSAWIKPVTSTATSTIVTIGHGTTAGQLISLELLTANTAQMTINPDSGSTITVAGPAGTINDGAWGHILMLSPSATSHTVYTNGVAGTTVTTNKTFPTCNTFTIGANNSGGTHTLFADCMIGEVAVWSYSLDAADITALANGACPLSIRTDQDLEAYIPMWGNTTAAQDIVGNYAFTATGSPTASNDHPRVFYPPDRRATTAIAASSTPISGSDDMTLSEAYALGVSTSESVTETESGLIAITTSLAEAIAASEAALVGLTGTETPTGTETTTLTAAGNVTESVTATETTLTDLSASDMETETEAGSIAASIPDSDSQTLTDLGLLDLAGLESHTASESPSISAVGFVSDSISSTETTLTDLTDSDSFSITDVGSISVVLAVIASDDITLTESTSLSQVIAIVGSDSFSATELSLIDLSGLDSQTLAELFNLTASTVSSESFILAEESLISLSGVESITVNDSASVSASVLSADSITESDLGSLELLSSDSLGEVEVVTLSAAGTAVDAVLLTDSGSVQQVGSNDKLDSDTFVFSESVSLLISAVESFTVSENGDVIHFFESGREEAIISASGSNIQISGSRSTVEASSWKTIADTGRSGSRILPDDSGRSEV